MTHWIMVILTTISLVPAAIISHVDTYDTILIVISSSLLSSSLTAIFTSLWWMKRWRELLALVAAQRDTHA